MSEKVRPEDLTLHPVSRSPRFFAFDSFELGYVIAGVIFLYLGSEILPTPGNNWFTVIGAVVLLLTLIPIGRLNKRIVRLPGFYVANYKRSKRDHHRRWTEPPRRTLGAASSAETVDIKQRQRNEQSILPVRVVRLGDMGTVVNEKHRMITFIVRVSGTDITTKTIAQQKAFNEKLGEKIKLTVSPVRRAHPWVGFIYRSRPDNAYEYEKSLRELLDGRVMAPPGEEKPLDEWTEDDHINAFVNQVVVEEGMDLVETLVNPEMAITLTVRYSSRFAKVLEAAKKPGQNRAVTFEHKHLLKEPVMRLRDAALPLLREIYTGEVEVLDFDETVMYLRMGHDLNISEYNRQAYLAEVRGESLPSTSWMPEGYIDEYHDKLCVNGTWSATMLATTFTDEFALPYTAREFYTPRTTYYTAATIAKLTKGDHRYRTMQGMGDMSDGAREFFGIESRGPKAHRAAQDAYNKLAQLDRSGYAAAYQPMITVSKLSEHDLEAAMIHVDSGLDGVQFGPQRVIGSSVQWEEFFSASTGIPLKF